MDRKKCLYLLFFVAILLNVLWTPSAGAQAGTITGTATDADHDVLPSAPVKLDPGNISVATNGQGEFTITNVAPGTYTVAVTYLGFSPFTTSVTVTAGQVAKVDAVLAVATQNEQVVVTAGRSYGEAEAVNETRASDTLVNILPATVIRSLPNANVADAVGRLPGVTLERDEGEGKYVQVRGTEPRLSNLTIDGVEVPSPEGGVRQVKLDTIPADLIGSVQINKTLQSNLDGDAIGGSVNLVTKTAPERPTLSLYGSWGLTPIINKVPVSEFSGTVGQRFGVAKRLGVIISGGYDYNGRGIDDVEPTPVFLPRTTTLDYTGAAIRQYRFDRERYGFGASFDYKIGESSLIYVKSLYSDFMDNGHRWEYVLSTNQVLDGTSNTNLPNITTERRDGNYLVSSLLVGGNHVFAKSWFNWGVSASRSRLANPLNGGESITTFTPVSSFATSNCQYDPAATKSVYNPQFTPACFTEAYDPTQFQLNTISQSNHGKAAQLNLAAFASAARSYHLGSHNSTFEFGFKIRNGHKFDDSFTNDFQHNANMTPPTAPPVLETAFLGGFKNPNYYGGAYNFAPNSASWELANAYLAAHPGDFTLSSTQGGNQQNFDLVERVTAGYISNTLDFGRFRLIGGLRIEGTDEKTISFDTTDLTGGPNGTLSKKGGGSYVSYLPSGSLRFRLDNSSDLKLIYSRALARPDPVTLTSSFSIDNGTKPSTVFVGNDTLIPEHANNYDLLYERYLTPLGLIQAGFFYKDLTSPVVNNLAPGSDAFCTSAGLSTPPSPFCLVSTPVNGGSAYVTGFEVAFQQHFAYLPGLLSGLGVSANYSYTASQANNVNVLRSDSPALLRQAPNTWNISPTYDRGRLSLRVGLAYNGANVFQYAYQNLFYPTNPDGTNSTTPTPIPGGVSVKSPSGDIYLYAHFQVDAEGSFRVRRGLHFTAGGLNLNNEVFGFYLGSPQFPFQREYYKPTYTFGMRWEPFAGRN
jgi:TonB-dependent receptor